VITTLVIWVDFRFSSAASSTVRDNGRAGRISRISSLNKALSTEELERNVVLVRRPSVCDAKT